MTSWTLYEVIDHVYFVHFDSPEGSGMLGTYQALINWYSKLSSWRFGSKWRRQMDKQIKKSSVLSLILEAVWVHREGNNSAQEKNWSLFALLFLFRTSMILVSIFQVHLKTFGISVHTKMFITKLSKTVKLSIFCFL